MKKNQIKYFIKAGSFMLFEQNHQCSLLLLFTELQETCPALSWLVSAFSYLHGYVCISFCEKAETGSGFWLREPRGVKSMQNYKLCIHSE